MLHGFLIYGWQQKDRTDRQTNRQTDTQTETRSRFNSKVVSDFANKKQRKQNPYIFSFALVFAELFVSLIHIGLKPETAKGAAVHTGGSL